MRWNSPGALAKRVQQPQLQTVAGYAVAALSETGFPLTTDVETNLQDTSRLMLGTITILTFAFTLATAGGLCYAAFHFITKFW